MNFKLLARLSVILMVAIALTSCGAKAPNVTPITAGFTPSAVCLVPNVTGLDQAAAEGMLADLGLQPVKSVQDDPSVAKDAVISQKPAAGTRLEPCTGDVIIVVSRGPLPKPTDTPAPPTLTPTATPIPFTATPTPDPRLFWDDFENGIKPEWGMTGENFLSANGKLVSTGHMEGSLGNSSWTNYSIIFTNPSYGSGNKVTLFMRWQDQDNYMKMMCNNHVGGWWACDWYRVVDGKEQLLAGTPHDVGYDKKNWQVDVDSNGVYRMIVDGEVKFRFVDSTYSHGGIKLMLDGDSTFELESFEVVALP